MKTVATVNGALLASHTRARRFLPSLRIFVVDSEIKESIEFCVEHSADRSQLKWMNTDMIELWYEQLLPLCSERRFSLSGLTRQSDWFILQQYAKAYQYAPLSVEYRNSHSQARAKERFLMAWELAPI